ncbi:hypothetical protein PENTCL1PPCAC_1, partial [Pristionchus entomophagus]
MAIVWVRGDPLNTVVLSELNDEIIEGIATNQGIVGIRVINSKDEEMTIERNQVMGHWKKSKECEAKENGRVAVVSQGLNTPQGEGNWNELMEKLREHHEEGIDERVMKILREYEGVFAMREEELGRMSGYECGIELMDERPLTLADFEIEDGILYGKNREHNKLLYVPEEMREKIVRETHESVLMGHAGSKKLNQLLKREFIWGGLEKDVAAIVGKCTRCRLSNAQKRFVPQLVPRVVKEPMKMVAIDLLDLGRGLKGGSMQLLMRKTHTEVNERLKEEREKMKRQYDEKNRFRKNDEPKIGDRVYVKKEIRGEKNAKLVLEWEGP